MKKIELSKYYQNDIDKNILLLSLVKNIVNKIKKQNYSFMKKSILKQDSFRNFSKQFYTNVYIEKKDSFSKTELDSFLAQVRLLDLIDEGRVTVF